MKHRYINLAYEKIYNSEIEDIKEIDGVKYALPFETNVFFGNEQVVGDWFKVNDEKPEAKKIANKIYFKVKDETLKFEIDYNHRLDIMQQITANAIVRMIISKTTKLNVKDYKINNGVNKIYIDSKDISFMQIEQIESVANHLILSNLSTNNTDNFVMIRGYGSIESIGPVCERIGELGLLKIHSASRENNQVVLYLLSGNRAINDYFEKSKIVDNLSLILNVEQTEILKTVKELKFKNKSYPSKSVDNNIAKETSIEHETTDKAKEDIVLENENKVEQEISIATISESDVAPISEASSESNQNETTENEDVSSNMSAENEVIQDEVINNESVQDEIVQDEVIQDKIVHDEIIQDEIVHDEIIQDETTPDDVNLNLEETEKTEMRENSDENSNSNTELPEIKLDEKLNVDNKKEPLLSADAEKMLSLATNVDGLNFIYKVFRNKSLNEVTKAAREISNLPDYIQIIGIPMGDFSNFFVIRSKNVNIDLKNILQSLNSKLFVKSSGNMFEVEGTVATQNLATVMESFLLRIKN